MNLGERGAAIIKQREELRLVAYIPMGGDKWTIGWGHTRGVHEGMKCTAEQAQAWFVEDTRVAVSIVNRVVEQMPVRLSQAAFDALVSLVFNAGDEPLWPTRTIGAALHDGRVFDAWAGFALWRKQGGADRRGLARRRAEEMALFMADPLP